MTPENKEEVAGGALGKVAGRLKEAAGDLLGNEEVAREGRLQEAGADAELEARECAAKARVASKGEDDQSSGSRKETHDL